MKLYWSQMVLLSALAILLLLPPSAAAQSAEELAKQTQNPIANLISVPLQANWDFGLGDRKAVGTVLNFQPVMPFSLNKSTNLILRVIVPMLSQPTPDGTRINGLGDVVMTAFFSPKKTGKVIWGVGPALLLPVATNNSFGSEKFGLGPSFVVLAQPGKFTVGLLFNSIWSVAGAKTAPMSVRSYWQPFLNYNLGNGLAVGVSSEISANWKADEKWSSPLLFSSARLPCSAIGR